LLTGLIRLAGIMFPENGCPVEGSMIGVASEEKFPCRKSASGTVAEPSLNP
jgi:hypothetical protein